MSFNKVEWIKIYHIELMRVNELIYTKWLEKCLIYSRLIRVLLRNRMDHTTELERDLLTVLAHSIMEAKKSHNLPSASDRKASDTVPVRVPGLRTRWGEGTIPHPGAGEDGCPSSVRQRASSSSLHLFVLFRPSTPWMGSTHTGEDNLLYPIN